MKPRERALAALNLQEPDDIVPTFELEFQLTEELFGKGVRFLTGEDLKGTTGEEREKLLIENALLMIRVADVLDYSIIRVNWLPTIEDEIFTIKFLKKEVGAEYLIACEASGTYGIPSGENMEAFAYFLFDQREEAHRQAERMRDWAIERSKRLSEAGLDCVTHCTDYCFNAGPFLSPKMFSEFVTPYLQEIISAQREMGLYVILHTDGNIMPIIDQLISARPHALHSLDPMAKVDIKEVKRLYGDKVCLCGNVNCAILHMESPRMVMLDTLRVIRDASVGGGHILTTSNVPFKGMPLENYLAMLYIRQRYARYPIDVEGIEKEILNLKTAIPS
ncbi:MAG: uroporphyrinogen decarboxylase family protein [bacterium]